MVVEFIIGDAVIFIICSSLTIPIVGETVIPAVVSSDNPVVWGWGGAIVSLKAVGWGGGGGKASFGTAGWGFGCGLPLKSTGMAKVRIWNKSVRNTY